MFSLEFFILTQRYHIHFVFLLMWHTPWIILHKLQRICVVFLYATFHNCMDVYSSASIFFFLKYKQEFETFCHVKHHQSNFITSNIVHFKLLKFKKTKKGFFLSVKWYEQETVLKTCSKFPSLFHLLLMINPEK